MRITYSTDNGATYGPVRPKNLNDCTHVRRFVEQTGEWVTIPLSGEHDLDEPEVNGEATDEDE